MGNSTSRVVGCLVPSLGNGDKDGVDLDFLEPLDEGLGHSFCYVRPVIVDSPALTPSNSERFTVDSSTLESETHSGSFRQEVGGGAVDDLSGLQRPNKNFQETTFKTISGASVSANVSTARTVNPSALSLAGDAQEPAASFKSTASFAAIPLQPVPRGSGPLNGFLSGPLERGFMSGPIEKGAFMSGPIEKGAFMSGPLDSTDKSDFSAPLAYGRRRPGLKRLMRSMSRPMRSAISHTISRHISGPGWMQRLLMTQFAWHPKEAKLRPQEVGPSEVEYINSRNLQWAHGKAGEDRVHVVLSEEQGWLFVGIYDGFSGPDAPDFLMSNLYRAIDKELEGLLWDYEDKPQEDILPKSGQLVGEDLRNPSEPMEEECSATQLSEPVVCDCSEETCYVGASNTQSTGDGGEIIEEKDEVKDMAAEFRKATETGKDCKANPLGPSNAVLEGAAHGLEPKLEGQGRKSKRLYELLGMEDFVTFGNSGRTVSWDSQLSVDGMCSRDNSSATQPGSCSVRAKGDCSGELGEWASTREDEGMGVEGSVDSGHGVFPSCSSSSGHNKPMVKRSLIGARLRQMYRKQKSLRKKLFPWSYDWHREQAHVEERLIADSSVTARRSKLGPVDHVAVLNAMSRALETTEEAYMEMVENSLDGNPELALMGSCVLVMLMKDQDVYVMNLGDSRAILAQDRLNDRHANPVLAKDDLRHRNRSRESLVRVELDRISEESPMHNKNSQVCKVNKNREISICRLKMRAVQLSIDHSTGIQEEVLRIKAEHVDDSQAVFNDRVKGQLKVTRAFGAGFLKKPKFNEALLEMFRIDYIGSSPYVSCIPSVHHHRLCSSDRFLVLSSDGLYEYFSNEEVVSHVAWFMENVPEGDPAQYLIAELLFRAAKKNGMDFHELLHIPQGDRRKYHDDVSVMVVSLEGRIWKSSG
ncbi:Protein phosphatase 2C 32 [Acorus calamus]|uniref:protein-serine/threonine phosphatase n=1 Tax=Acorus calamus TaxID=4465 RepID=A0AAV9F0Y5_ACOCL|nr:Protein phosphatase 2C 32 [Acorus calamus]